MRIRALLHGSVLGVSFCVLCAAQIWFSHGAPVPGQTGAQPPNQQNQVRTVSGTVVNSVTGEPIARALVRVLYPVGVAGLTDSNGHFALQNAPANVFSIVAEKPGYGFQKGPSRVSALEDNVTLKLTPDGGIHGRVVDEEGQPLEGVQIQTIAETIMGGRKREQPSATTTTDDNGEYDLSNLPQGTYFVHTVLKPLYMTLVPLAAAQRAYPAEFYPNAPDRAAAQPLQIQPGQTAEADFALKPVQTFRVTGVLTGGGTGESASVTLKGPDGARSSVPIRVDWRTGQFSLMRVPAGSYTLEFRTYAGRETDNSFYAEQPVNVNGADVENLQVSWEPLSPIPVNVVHPPDTQAANTAPGGAPRPSFEQVQLTPRDLTENGGGFYWAEPERHGYFSELRVPPGSYHVAVRTSGSECLDTVSSGSTDLTREDLTVSAGAAPQPITVTLRSDCATLTGTVHAEGRTAPVQVLLVPASGAAEPQVIGTAPESQFTVPGLTPGTYRVYAFSSLDNLEYTNPDALRDFDAQEITLDANQQANVTLNLIVRGGE